MAIKKGKSDSREEIEELKQSNKELVTEIARLQKVIDNLPGSIYWKNADGVYLGVNKHSHEMMKTVNLEHKSIIGKTDYDLFPKDVADVFRKNDLLVLQKGQTITEEEPTFVDNKKIYQLSTKKPLRDDTGKIVGIVGNTVDISYLKKIEAELRTAKEKAEDANRIKTEFIHNMEHDIRTPFSGIWGLASYLWERETDPEKKEYLGDITRSAKELLDYCNGILDFSRIEQGDFPVLLKKFSIKEVLNNIIIVEKPAAKHKDLNLILDCSSNVPSVLIGDRYRLYRILINLVSNAIKFTIEGKIKLIVKNVKQKGHKEVIIKFIVEDTGIGIPKEKQDFIFEKFSRVSQANRGIYKGIGLGLRIVRQFVAEMEGEIDITSKAGEGTIFICTLPFKLPLTDDHTEE